MMEEVLSIKFLDPKQLKANEYSRQFFPELKGDAFNLLLKDIEANGIRTPLEITKDKLVLCGHERLRIALELGLKLVPITVFPSDDKLEQQERVIKDNLARKDVSYRAKMKCYAELQRLHGLKHGQTKVVTVDHSTERSTKLSESEIAHEVGLSPATFDRARKIEESKLPEEIKTAALEGMKLGIRPVADLVDEPKEVQKQVIPQILEKLKEGDEGFSVEAITREVKTDLATDQLMKDLGVPPLDKQIKDFYSKVSPHEKTRLADTERRKLLLASALRLFHNDLKCPVCGNGEIKRSCGHGF